MSWVPNWTYGYVPTTAQWNDAFGRKQDNLGYTPLNQAGGTMVGKLNIVASTAESSGFRLFQGVAPSDPEDGDMWVEATGLFIHVNNVSVGPLVAGNSITNLDPVLTGTIDNMIIGGTTSRAGTFTTLKASSGVTPVANDGGALGSTTLQWSDLFLANGGVLNFNNGNVTVTHSSNLLTISKGLTVNGAAAFSPANANVVISPTGTGLVTINPATVGGMDNMVIGASTPKALTATTLALSTGTIASAATTDLSTIAGSTISVTGNATITSFGTMPAGSLKFLRFTGTPTLTYNATSMILPGAANIVVIAGDTAVLQSLGSGNWLVLSYQIATVPPPQAASQAQQEGASSNAVFVTPGRQVFHPSAAKAFACVTQSGGTYSLQPAPASYGVASITKNGTGDVTVTWSTAFSSALYVPVASPQEDGNYNVCAAATAAGSVRVKIRNGSTGSSIDAGFAIVAYGDL